MFRGQLVVVQILSANERNGTSVNHAVTDQKDYPYSQFLILQ